MSDERESLMIRDGMLVGIAGFSLLPGQHFSPWFDPAFIVVKALIAPAFYITSPLLLFYFTSLLVSVAALIVAGVPAALYERFRGQTESDVISLGIWLVGVLAMAIPVITWAQGAPNPTGAG